MNLREAGRLGRKRTCGGRCRLRMMRHAFVAARDRTDDLEISDAAEVDASAAKGRGATSRWQTSRQDVQVFHQHIQYLGSPVRAVNPTQHWRHVGLFDRLERFHHRCQVNFLSLGRQSPHLFRAGLSIPEHPPTQHHRRGGLTLAVPSPPYGAFSKAPLKAPSASPPRSRCLH